MEQQLTFLREIDQLKSIIRKSPLINQSRKENSAEHSWHLALYALILSDTSDKTINTDRVIRMLLIHDIVEIDAGDFPIHETNNTQRQEEQEQLAAKRIFGLLPEQQAKELMELWQEFEAGDSNDAAFAKSLDRMQPLIHNIETKGGTWNEANVTQDQIHERYGTTISKGSTSLWRHAKQLVEQHFSKVLNK